MGEVLNNRELALEMVQFDGYDLQYYTPEIRADREVVMAAVTQNGHALEFTTPDLQAERDIVLTAVNRDGHALRFANAEFQKDEDVVLLAFRKLRYDDHGRLYDEFQEFTEDERFQDALESPIAVKGEQDTATVSVSLSLVQLEHSWATEQSIHCKVSATPEVAFDFSFTHSTSADQPGTKRSTPIVDDLAWKILGELPKHIEAAGVKRLFVTIDTKEAGGSIVPVTPWDWEKPLIDFLVATS
mmetsp:Transcript_38132/g.82419  ORF Transcript_38132/g.82419 Transcript_38132/m.82419 type:complete len:243 (-) Transcript_38132:169-897(-)